MAVRATEAMVRRHINHPSILFWAFLNEVDSGLQPTWNFATFTND